MLFTPPHGDKQQPMALAGDCATSLIGVFLGAEMGNPTRRHMADAMWCKRHLSSRQRSKDRCAEGFEESYPEESQGFRVG